MVPVPLPLLSAPAAIAADIALWNSASGPGGTVPSGSVALVSLTATVWVSVRSTSLKVSVPEVGTSLVSGPPATLVPPSKVMVGTLLVITGLSLVPVIVMVIVLVAVSGLTVKLLAMRTV
ncbi:hypothetical protein ACVWWG_002301 [Bradyrhizobium sp. LB7.2]